MSTEMLLPQPDQHSQPFWDGCLAGELRVQRCEDCGRRRMPPRPMCPHCGSFDHVWEATSGRGRIWSYVVPHPPLLAAYEELLPYVVAVIELDEDPTIRFVGMVEPPDVTIGAAVKVGFDEPVDDGEGPVRLPRWTIF